jgi:hypothetical protein
MDEALDHDLPAAGGEADDPLADRYAIGAQLGQNDRVQTFRATDRRLDRPVVMVVETGSGGETLAETCQALAGALSPNMVEIYDRGESATHSFVVCELPMSTVASLVEDPGQSLWNESWASDTAEQLALALADLHGSGVDTSGLHFGHVGIDGSGRVRLSPWPLAEPPEGSPIPASQQELVASVRDSGVRASRSFGSSKAAEFDANLRQTSAEDHPLTPDLLPGALAGVGASVDDKPTGDVALNLDLPSGALAGVGASVDDKPTGELPVTPNLQPGALAGVGASVSDEPTGDVALNLDLLSGALAGVGASVDDKPTGDVALNLDLLSGVLAGVGASVDDKPTGELPVTPNLQPGALAGVGASVSDEPTGDIPLNLDLPSGALAGVEASVDDEPMGELPVTPNLQPGALAGVEASVDDEPMGELPVTTGVALLSQEAASPADRGRHRMRWPLAAGVGLSGAAAFLAFSLVSYNPPAPADASTNAAGACAGKTQPCAVQTVSKSPSTTVVGLQLPITPVNAATTTTGPPPTTTTTTTKAAGATGGAVPPVGTAPTTSEAPSTTTTTGPPPTTTTTEPPSTTTTTGPPPTTTTTTGPPPTTTTTTTGPPPTTTTTTPTGLTAVAP